MSNGYISLGSLIASSARKGTLDNVCGSRILFTPPNTPVVLSANRKLNQTLTTNIIANTIRSPYLIRTVRNRTVGRDRISAEVQLAYREGFAVSVLTTSK